jgi:hypothetical protein
MEVSRVGSAAPDDGAQDYGNALAETSAFVGTHRSLRNLSARRII